ncbi:MAG: AMIN domain-containing protein [Bacteroidales bacterium]
MLRKATGCQVLAAALLVAGTAALSAGGTSLRTVRVVAQGATTAVVIEADGPLPTPRVGVLRDPPRIYLDFAGVKTATSGTYPDVNAPVHGVRVAINQAQPLVTRVVLDLATPMPHSIDATSRERGQLTILVGPAPQAAVVAAATPPPVPAPPSMAVAPPTPAPAAAAAAPAVAVPAPGAEAPPAAAAPAARPPADAASRAEVISAFAAKGRAPGNRPSPKDVEKYLQKAALAILRLERVRPILVSLDALAAVHDAQLKKAAEEFQAIRRVLVAVNPPRSLKQTHDELCEVCTLGTTAATARLDRTLPDATRGWSAASAAAGALMLLERAQTDLGLGPRSRP